MKRITPACAGNSEVYALLLLDDRDHPRVCGEQNYARIQRGYHAGSPPRVRGTGPWLIQSPGGVGITPACAGNRALLSVYISSN